MALDGLDKPDHPMLVALNVEDIRKTVEREMVRDLTEDQLDECIGAIIATLALHCPDGRIFNLAHMIFHLFEERAMHS